jgi:hypothetical protein
MYCLVPADCLSIDIRLLLLVSSSSLRSTLSVCSTRQSPARTAPHATLSTSRRYSGASSSAKYIRVTVSQLNNIDKTNSRKLQNESAFSAAGSPSGRGAAVLPARCIGNTEQLRIQDNIITVFLKANQSSDISLVNTNSRINVNNELYPGRSRKKAG